MDETKGSQKQSITCTVGNSPQNNIEQILFTILSFTKTRQKILVQNIRNIDRPGFSPKDLPSEEFAQILGIGLNEHISNNRIILCDSKNVRFGLNGSFRVTALEDHQAKHLLGNDRSKYIQIQTAKLIENAINQRLAMMMLSSEPQEVLISE